jgi:hypothetical protein
VNEGKLGVARRQVHHSKHGSKDLRQDNPAGNDDRHQSDDHESVTVDPVHQEGLTLMGQPPVALPVEVPHR